jgi:hypothetical protein
MAPVSKHENGPDRYGPRWFETRGFAAVLTMRIISSACLLAAKKKGRREAGPKGVFVFLLCCCCCSQ